MICQVMLDIRPVWIFKEITISIGGALQGYEKLLFHYHLYTRMNIKMNCAICKITGSIRYQCCVNDEHSLCESCCINIISTIINNGKIGLLFNKKIPCYVCNEKFQYENLPKSLQIDIENIFLTIPKTSKNPKTIQEFNYYYNHLNQLRHCVTNKKFIFISQRHYELLGRAIQNYIQSLMKTNPWNYQEIRLESNQVNIFISNDFQTNLKGCLILIQGIGAVRAGQWSRSCCINESLDIGAMFPYMLKAKEYNLSVIILNPNQTNSIDKEETFTEDLLSFYLSSNPHPCSSSKPIPDLSTGREHILYVYDNIITKLCPTKKFYFVAHSAGGDHLMYLLRQRQNSILPKLSKIAFIDSIHSILSSDTNELKEFLGLNSIHFIASDQPMGKLINHGEVSAGHSKHEDTSGYCINGVFNFFFSSLTNIDH